MYWEEVIELIKTHTDDVVSEYPNPLNDGDYITYEYERGTVKSSYIHIDEFPEKIKDVLKPYLKYGITDLQIFSSLGPSEGIGIHNDPTNVLILCLEGEIAYIVEKFHGATPEDEHIQNDPVILRQGDTIFIRDGLQHAAVSSKVPRICISCAVKGIIPKEEVTYYT